MHPLFNEYMKLMTALYTDLEKAFDGLPAEALDWVPGQDMNSFCVLVVHVTGSTRHMIGYFVGGMASNRDRAAEFTASGLDAAALKARIAENKEFVRGVLENLTLDDLTKIHQMKDRDRTYTKAEWLLHALEHIGVHVGHAQITRQLWDQKHG
jgi:uncharacterized damage-inducible protein DinB